MIPLLEEQDWQTNEAIARKVNEIIAVLAIVDDKVRAIDAKVNALMRQFVAHEAREGGQAAWTDAGEHPGEPTPDAALGESGEGE